MRTHLLLAAAALVAPLLAACAPGANGELRSLVEEVAPIDGEMVECNWGTNWGDDSGSYYGCFYAARGTAAEVAQILIAEAAERGFIVTCRVQAREVELIGARDDTMLYAHVMARRLSDADLPQGHVLVEVVAFEDEAGVQEGRLCATPY